MPKISFLTLLACGPFFRLLAFLSDLFFKNLKVISFSSVSLISLISLFSLLISVFLFLIFFYICSNSLRLSGFVALLRLNDFKICSNEIHSLVPQVWVFTTTTMSNHSHFSCLPLLRREFHSNSFLSRTATLWNKPPRGCIPKHNSRKLFKYGDNWYLSSSLSFTQYLPSLIFSNLYHEWFMSLDLGEHSYNDISRNKHRILTSVFYRVVNGEKTE